MNTTQQAAGELIVSAMAENLIGSEIIKLAGEINEKIKNGEKIFNLTIGDFNPQLFPIPALLKEEIIKHYNLNETNYPPADGMPTLRLAVANIEQMFTSANKKLKKIQQFYFKSPKLLTAKYLSTVNPSACSTPVSLPKSLER